MSTGIERAVETLRGARHILVFTGAGISTESGIPDFRGPNGLWTKVDPDDFTIARYVSSIEVRKRNWEMHRHGELWGARSQVRPNAAHEAVTDLWRSGRLTGVITQNIDGLHLVSGLPPSALAEVHGNIRRCRCLGCGQTWDTETVLEWVDAGDADPHCPQCGDLVKTTTVLFGELLPEHEVMKAEMFSSSADAVLVVGSTLSVYPAADFALRVRMRGGPMVVVNVGATDHDHLASVLVSEPAGTAVPAIVSSLV